MATIIKPRTLGILTKSERRRVGASFIVSAFGMFDLSHPDHFEGDQALWMAAAEGVAPGSFLDIGMPKPCAEILVGGKACPAGGVATPAMLLDYAIGPVSKRIAVVGDRYWTLDGRGMSDPVPFTSMPLDPARAFGGPGHPTNPGGLGYRAHDRMVAGELVALPNLEDIPHLIGDPLDNPQPILFGPGDPTSPERRRYAGTYDQAWLDELAPALPDDADPRLFLIGPEDQRLPGYLAGDEPYRLIGFAADTPGLEGRLPGFRVRAFLGMEGRPNELVELPMVIDTLWLMAGLRRGILIYRGAQAVADIDGLDVRQVMLAYERMTDPPRSYEHYLETLARRTDPENAHKTALDDRPLSPLRSEELDAEKLAARIAYNEAERDRRHAASVFMMERQLEKSGLPPSLWPEPPPPPPVTMIFPTPEEFESGDIDYGALFDGLDAERKRMEETVAQIEADAEKTRAAMEGIDFTKEDGGLDALLASLGGDPVENPLKAVDAALAAFKPPEKDPLAPEGSHEKLMDALAEAGSFREKLAAAQAGPDDETLLERAIARFRRLPEGSLLYEVRQAMGNLTDFKVPGADDLGAILDEITAPGAPTPPPPRPPQPVSSIVAEGLAIPELPGEKRAEVTAKLDELDATLRSSFPKLAGREGSALDALLADLAQPDAEPLPSDPRAAIAAAEARIGSTAKEVEAELDAMEASYVEGMTQARRSTPGAMFPADALSPTSARRFGEVALADKIVSRSFAGCDLAGVDLAGVDLTGWDLTGVFLEKADLRGTRFAGAKMTQATLTEADLTDADLTGVDLTEANLSKARLNFARLDGARLDNARAFETDFGDASLKGASLADLSIMMAKFSRTDFTGARLSSLSFLRSPCENTIFDDAVLERCQLIEANLVGVRFRNATMRECAFLVVEATGADFTSADLAKVSFLGGCGLERACFDGAWAPGTSWHKAKMTGATFKRAVFDGAVFSEADVSSANLRLVSLRGARLDFTRLAGSDLVGACLHEAQMRRTDLTGARLRGASLYGANMADAQLDAADFTKADLGVTRLSLSTAHKQGGRDAA